MRITKKTKEKVALVAQKLKEQEESKLNKLRESNNQ